MDFRILMNKILLIEISYLSFVSLDNLQKNHKISGKMLKYAKQIYVIFHDFFEFFEYNIKR
jgi:hypothetical protein